MKSILLATTALLALAGVARAADAVAPYEPAEAPAVIESRIKGAFEIGFWANNYDQTDDNESDTPLGGYATAFINFAVTPSFIIAFDAQAEMLDIRGDDFGGLAPSYASVIGGSLNYRFGDASIGAFAGAGVTDHEESDIGALGGLQASYDFGTTTVYGQVGYADIRVDEEDSGFTGGFGRLGVVHGFTDRIALGAAVEYGHAKEGYEDTGDEGTFWSAGLKGAMRIAETPVFATASYDYRKFEANTEDEAHENSFRIGISIPFGGAATAKDTFNVMATPVTPFRAASYGEVLD